MGYKMEVVILGIVIATLWIIGLSLAYIGR